MIGKQTFAIPSFVVFILYCFILTIIKTYRLQVNQGELHLRSLLGPNMLFFLLKILFSLNHLGTNWDGNHWMHCFLNL